MADKHEELERKLKELTDAFDKIKENIDDLHNHPFFYGTSLDKLNKQQEEYNKKLEETNKFLKDNKKDIDKYNDALKKIKKSEEEIEKIEKEIYDIQNDSTKTEKERKEEIRKKNIELKKEKDIVKEQTKIANKKIEYQEKLNDLKKDENALQQQLNERMIEGRHKMDDYGESLEKRFRALKKGYKETSEGVKQIYTSLTKTLEPWNKANQEAMTYAKTMGMSKKTADAFLDKTVSWAAKNDIGLLFNKTTAELIKMQSKYSEVLGRNVQLTSEQKKDMLAMETFLGEDGMMDIANNLENFGLGLSDSAEFVKKTIDDATKSGIVASKLTKTVRENIKMAQNYTFKNGLDGLTSMAKKAIQLKTDMSLVNGFLEKTSTVEGAITTGAQLQVLGGNYALGSDPLSMMYESLNDMEGLFDRAVGMVQGKVFYDNKTGNFDMTAMDRYMMKQAATSMGIDPSKLIDVAFRKASLDKIEGQIKANSNISDDAEMVEMVKNLATWDKGNGVVNINGKDKKISELNASDKTYLEQMQKTDSQNLQEMAITLRSVDEKLSGVGKEINNEQADYISSIGQWFDGLLNNTKGLNDLAHGGALFNILGGATGILGGVWTTAAGVWRTAKGIGNVFRGKGPSVNGSTVSGKVKGGILRGGKEDVFTGSNGQKYVKEGGHYRNLNTNTTASTVSQKNISRQFTKRAIGKSALKGLKSGGAVAALGAAISIGSDIATGEFKKNAGLSIGKAAGPAIGSILGGVVGGPLGAMIGGALGGAITDAWTDTIKKKRDELRHNIASELSSINPSMAGLFEGENAMQGGYSKSGLEDIKRAIEDGVLDENDNLGWLTIRKLRRNGDLERMSKSGIDVRIPLASGGYLEGKSHTEGGMPILGSNISVEGGEFVVNKEATKRNLPLLTEINNGNYDMTSKEPLGKIMKVKKHNYTEGINMPHNSNMKIEPVSINLSGTIKLDAGNRQVDISNELLNNPILITKLTEMISKQINRLDNGAYNKGVFKQKFT